MADPICQLAHLCSHSMKDQSKNPQMPLGQQPKLGQLHYPFHPRLKVLLKTASVTSPDKTTIVLPATTVVSPAKYKNSANKWHTSSQQQQHNKPNSDSTSHHPSSTLQSPNNNLSQVFIAQVTTAVAQIQNETTQPSTKPNK